METPGNERPFWRKKASKVITYDVTGTRDELLVTRQRGAMELNRDENFDPVEDFQFLPGQKFRLEDGYVIQKGTDSPQKVKLLRKKTTQSNLDSDQDEDRSEYELNITKHYPL